LRSEKKKKREGKKRGDLRSVHWGALQKLGKTYIRPSTYRERGVRSSGIVKFFVFKALIRAKFKRKMPSMEVAGGKDPRTETIQEPKIDQTRPQSLFPSKGKGSEDPSLALIPELRLDLGRAVG